MSPRAVGAVLAGLGLLLAVAACTGPDLEEVPTEAAEPFVCAGVPAEGVTLLLGADAARARTSGHWGDDGIGFDCVVELESGDPGRVMVISGDVGIAFGSGDATEALEEFSAQGDAAAIDADAAGGGYVYGSGEESATAAWVCDSRVLSVEAFDVDVEGRELRADVENLLVSMLPWACGDEEAPAGTVQGQ